MAFLESRPMNNPFETSIKDENKNLFYEQMAKHHENSADFVAKIKWLRMCAETAATDTGCTRTELLMMAIDYEFKQLTASTPMTAPDALTALEPLAEMLQEGIVIDARFFEVKA